MSIPLKSSFVVVAAAAAGLLLAAWLALPWPILYRWVDPERTSVMRYRMRRAAAAGDTLVLQHRFVPLKDMSPAMVRAVVAAEDGRFREHRGIDWQALGEELEYAGEPPFSWTDPADLRALLGAARYYWAHRDEVRGRSTITQQLAKNLYWTPERSLARKVGEFVVARRLEWFLGKDRILELYLNSVELGPGIFGVDAAARAYFDTSAADLTPWQAASLAATLPHPLTSNPAHRPGRMSWRRDLILERIQGGGGRDLPPIPHEPEEPAMPDPADLAPTGPGAPGDTVPGAPRPGAPPADTTPPDTVASPDTAGTPADPPVAPPDTTVPDTARTDGPGP